MRRYVVDTNVAVVANGRGTDADEACQLRCIEVLEDVCARQVVVMDDGDRIFDEYRERLHFNGVPGVGDKFFKHVFYHQYGGGRVRRVPITLCSDERRGFEELPRNDLDRSDRKFLAAAVVGGAIILNAVDSDWGEQEALTEGLGVPVEQLCPQQAAKRAAGG